MGKLAVYKYFSFLFLIAPFAVAGFTIFGLFGGNVTPAGNTARAMLVYVLPLLIIANIVMLLVWLIRRRWHWAAIPFVTLLCCIPYREPSTSSDPADKSVDAKAGTEDCHLQRGTIRTRDHRIHRQDILAEMKTQKVEVLCMQEYNDVSGDKINSENYKEYFPYMAKGRDDMMIFSRYPITGSKTIDFEETNNSAMWADINVKGKEYRIFNVHLETTGMNRTIRKAAKMAMQGFQVEESRLLRAIYGNYTMGMIVRAGQAERVAQDIRESKRPSSSAATSTTCPTPTSTTPCLATSLTASRSAARMDVHLPRRQEQDRPHRLHLPRQVHEGS